MCESGLEESERRKKGVAKKADPSSPAVAPTFYSRHSQAVDILTSSLEQSPAAQGWPCPPCHCKQGCTRDPGDRLLKWRFSLSHNSLLVFTPSCRPNPVSYHSHHCTQHDPRLCQVLLHGRAMKKKVDAVFLSSSSSFFQLCPPQLLT